MGQDRGGLRGSGEAQSTPGGEGSPSGSHSPWCTWLPESGGFAAPLLGACQLMRSGLSPTPTPTASGYMANRDLSWRWCLQPQPATIKQPQHKHPGIASSQQAATSSSHSKQRPHRPYHMHEASNHSKHTTHRLVQKPQQTATASSHSKQTCISSSPQ